PTTYLQMLFRGENSGTSFILPKSFNSPSTHLAVFFPQLVWPAPLFGLSRIRLTVSGRPLLNTNIYSSICVYLTTSLLAGNDEVFFSYIIVSCSLNPASINSSACLNDVPDPLPFIVASPTTHPPTPPFLPTRNISLAMVFTSKSNP